MHEPADPFAQPFRKLPRSFRLKNRRLIRALFDRTRSDVGTVAGGSTRIIYRIVPREEVPSSAPIQVGFAPGRIRRAVDRNRVKRILREVYRLHQTDLLHRFADSDRSLTMMILHRGDAAAAAERIPQDLPRTIRKLLDALAEPED